MQTFPAHFLTHNNAIAGFTSQSLGLPAYACKTGSSTAMKLATRMHQNLLCYGPPNGSVLFLLAVVYRRL